MPPSWVLAHLESSSHAGSADSVGVQRGSSNLGCPQVPLELLCHFFFKARLSVSFIIGITGSGNMHV